MRMRELELSKFINVVSLDRDAVLHFPRGGTCFDAGDIITLFGRKNFLEPTRERFFSGKEEKI
jgi:Trk K+ transport system NAD-binding subunit